MARYVHIHVLIANTFSCFHLFNVDCITKKMKMKNISVVVEEEEVSFQHSLCASNKRICARLITSLALHVLIQLLMTTLYYDYLHMHFDQAACIRRSEVYCAAVK